MQLKLNKLCFLLFFSILFFTNATLAKNYYEINTDYLIAPSGASRTGLSGFINPALTVYEYQPEFNILFQDSNNSPLSSKAIFLGAPNIGGAIFTVDNATMYQISGALGDKIFSAGLGFGFNTGYNVPVEDQGTYFLLGLLYRPNNYFSFGASSKIKTQGNTPEEIFDLAFRPWGSDTFTLFGDFGLEPNTNLDKSPWSVGATWQIIDGFKLTGRYFRDHSFVIGVDLSAGYAGINYKINTTGNQTRTYGLRIGNYDNSLFPQLQTRYLKIDLSKQVPYRNQNFWDDNPTLIQMTTDIRNAKNDPSIKGIIINYTSSDRNFSQNPSILWEIRDELANFKTSNKKVIIFADYADIYKYNLMSVADQIILDPLGVINLQGVNFNRTYFKGSLEKLGIGFQEFKLFKYKTAYETFSNDKLSEADKEQYQIIINKQYDLLKQNICKSRNISSTDFDNIINESFLVKSAEAKEKKLIDKTGRLEDVEKIISEEIEQKPVVYISRSEIENNIESYGDEWGEKPKLALIYALGVCAMDFGMSAKDVAKSIQEAQKNPKIKAIIVRIDSPGGGDIPSDIINEAIIKAKKDKPVIISQGYVAASGGYWVGMNGTKIFAYPNTLTGSIGVISGYFWNKNLNNLLGISRDSLNIGKHADLGKGFLLADRPANEDEIKKINQNIMLSYTTFVDKAGKARGIKSDEMKNLAQGRVWCGKDADTFGLIDDIGGLGTAIETAKAMAHLSSKTQIEIIEMPIQPFINIDYVIKSQFSLNNLFITKQMLDFDEYLSFWLSNNGKAMPMCLDFYPNDEIFK